MTGQHNRIKADTERDELTQQILEHMHVLIHHIKRDVSATHPHLSPPQARLIFIISQHSDSGISVKELARLMSITPGAVTQFINGLIDKNLITRETDPADRRSIKIKLTPPAEKEIQNLKKDFFNSAARKFGALNTEEMKTLVNLVSKINPAPATEENLP
ncbi:MULTISPECIES: MarR family winged helix-turn-helix transcriptional regulator [Dehalococcoides]|uniref:MarR family transcriptional regulator n=1 Tax=Dehalococcoides mccartyi TaxID=61435 RepID=A0AB38Z8G2_9CHLR|nr:MarR family transcriptional regulator [Dehalococcoides mccartyi]OBW61651.1 MAG: MarR family transcriptional regulator [Dehalococcoides mccartyi]WRO06842.1 MarR family transcriptional regulator [Dehalococcoides mccartyi]